MKKKKKAISKRNLPLLGQKVHPREKHSSLFIIVVFNVSFDLNLTEIVRNNDLIEKFEKC
ncbi:hypothetical protein KUTeg_013506 [Tegillarca granosa]|uniref:Uncharacterized protein n=1 Tax=Tegillarca granosa TaxID=220873 RepID=A0ABQ9ETW8_TEGGR|nr:hypothetical protein KUTeg_013506 [Tegillarca granosa]